MADDDTIVTLDTGEQVKVTEEGEQILLPGPDPEIAAIMASREDDQARLAEIRQAQLDVLEQKRAELAAEPAVPPEKSIF